jgi:DNA-directed RNA polymerase subunit RPC12/RpoP
MPPAACDQCGHTELGVEHGSLGSFWKRRSLELTLYVCRRCSRAMTYLTSGGSIPGSGRADGAQP